MGFEPTRPFRDDRLAGGCLRPLGHLSNSPCRYARRFGGEGAIRTLVRFAPPSGFKPGPINQTLAPHLIRSLFWCPPGGSNSHSFRKPLLRRPRLPIPPCGQCLVAMERLELSRDISQWILSPLRLPITPHCQIGSPSWIRTSGLRIQRPACYQLHHR